MRTPVLEFRYTGIKDLAIYFNGSKRDLSGVETNTSSYNPLTAAVGTPAANNVSEDHGNYTLGANWKTSNQLTLRAEVWTGLPTALAALPLSGYNPRAARFRDPIRRVTDQMSPEE